MKERKHSNKYVIPSKLNMRAFCFDKDKHAITTYNLSSVTLLHSEDDMNKHYSSKRSHFIQIIYYIINKNIF